MHDAKVGTLANHEAKVYNGSRGYANLNFRPPQVSHISKILENPSIMRGVYCDGSSIRLRHDLPEPPTPEGETLLRVSMAGICDTDLQLSYGYMNYQGILGHEFVGVDESGLRYTAEINASCHACPTCLAGRPHHCPNRTVLGILGHDGAMADYVSVPSRNLHRIPDEVEDREAVFIEPLAAAFRIREQVETAKGDRVAILGDGKLGILCAWVLNQVADVTLIGKHESKLAIAGQGIKTRLLESVDTDKFDIVVDATGNPSGFETALGLVRTEGTVVLKTTIAGKHQMSLAPIVIDEVKVIGSRCGPFQPAIEALRTRSIDVKRLIEAEFSLDDAEDAFKAASRKGARKILLRVS